MHAVTVRQPQATAVLAWPGPNKLRMWLTSHRGELLIHAARRGNGDAPSDTEDSPAYGALLGIVDLVDCIATSSSDDPDESGHVWVLANPRPFDRPIVYSGRGAVGLFLVADTVLAGAPATG